MKVRYTFNGLLLVLVAFGMIALIAYHANADDQYANDVDFSTPTPEELAANDPPPELNYVYYVIKAGDEKIICEKYEYQEKWITMSDIIQPTNVAQELTEKYSLEEDTITSIEERKAVSREAVIESLNKKNNNGECFINSLQW
jgi:hypothetical protein